MRPTSLCGSRNAKSDRSIERVRCQGYRARQGPGWQNSPATLSQVTTAALVFIGQSKALGNKQHYGTNHLSSAKPQKASDFLSFWMDVDYGASAFLMMGTSFAAIML